MKQQLDFRHLLLSLSCLLGFLQPLLAQEEQTAKKAKRDDYKNVVKFNLTSQVIYRNAFLLGYERVIKPHQTLNISGGRVEFPLSLKLPESIRLADTKNSTGYTVAVDYRFYLASENRNPAPHGVYLAPFIMHHQFKNNRDLTYTDTSGNTNNVDMHTKIGFLSFGCQLGYQFVIKRRFVIDAVLLGPGITKYKFDVKLDGNLTPIDEETIAGKVIEALREKLPVLDNLAKSGKVNGSGVEAFWSVGFRYSISIGFRF
jgi:hypothetical protein